MSNMRSQYLRLLLPVLFAAQTAMVADEPYRKPPPEVLSILNAPPTPDLTVNPPGTHALLATRILYPPVAQLAEPMLRLAGVRINPRNHGPHNAILYRDLIVQPLNGGAPINVNLPPQATISLPIWSPDGKRFAFLNVTENSVDLWTGITSSGVAHRVPQVAVNASLGLGGGFGQDIHPAIQWMPDSRTLLVQTVPAAHATAPHEPAAPPGPHTQETLIKAGPAPTYEDLLKNAHDEDLFDYYATAQLARINIDTGRQTPFGPPAAFSTVEPSPDGQNVLVARLHKPYSYFHPYEAFAKEVEVWSPTGELVYKLATLPLADRVPIEGVPIGPRNYHWIPTEPAQLYWVEALDGGNPKETVPNRDRVMALRLDSQSEPRELMEVRQRFSRIDFGESGTLTLVTDYERNKRWVRTFAINPRDPSQAPKLIWSRNMQDRYQDPGMPVLRTLANGKRVMRQDGPSILLTSVGATTKGDRPLLRRFNTATSATDELFRCDDTHYEAVEDVLSASGDEFITRRESQKEAPNFFLYSRSSPPRQITSLTDTSPVLRKLQKQLVTYKRSDGVPLSFTLYLPPDYKSGTRLPTLVWAYPYEYGDADTAGQISGSTNRFTTVVGASAIFFALEGYAVLNNAAMPVIGDPETVNNTYVEQIVKDAEAAVNKAAEMGVTDPTRVGVGGHSYGAFMTANLLAHSSLFRAGMAESGAYNRTLTPFGFQSERRTLWEAPDVYLKMSPFLSADKIKGALLMIHGEADDNSGTFPIQSERMYAAVRGNGGTVRLVMLPYEAHGYRGRESIEHTLYEEIAWLNKYVKNAGKDTLPGSVQ